ncbi:hypothetical protein GPECTOR_84g311 [Gonium pectorale]|uniref:Uncharacterized protein n=1 Tax=Gonium pectorale TaxID=33097 RepID=A0A150G2A3_GONPE|nr:hypothetical protein GPECTOR_84g311 [Gonium pectorale]|eukprot:KXZ43635.1 hypothetical protein GPECTOR_84g311 [Gonium pectorale]
MSEMPNVKDSVKADRETAHVAVATMAAAEQRPVLVFEASRSPVGMEVVAAGLPKLAASSTGLQLKAESCITIATTYYLATPTRSITLVAPSAEVLRRQRRLLVLAPWAGPGGVGSAKPQV